MYKAISEIQTAFRARNLKHTVDQVGGNWLLRASMKGTSSTYDFLFIKDDDNGNDVAVRILEFVKFPTSRLEKAYEVLNEIQIQYRFIRFAIKEDGNAIVEYDFPVGYTNIGQGAIEIMMRITNILDICYPNIMKSIWA